MSTTVIAPVTPAPVVAPVAPSAARPASSPVATVSIRRWKPLLTGPGWIEFTRMPRSATSLAAVRMSPTSACLDVA